MGYHQGDIGNRVDLLLSGDSPMKRDDEMIRALLFEIEAHESPLYEFPLFTAENPEDQEKYFHLRLLCDEGFLEEMKDGIFRMRNQGHDLIATIRSDTAWNKTKKAMAKLQGPSLKMMAAIAEELVRQKAVELGILPKR